LRAKVLVRDDVAMIPDLEWIETELLSLLGADLTESPEPAEPAEPAGNTG
jgi:chemosensory pili system protein ChpC